MLVRYRFVGPGRLDAVASADIVGPLTPVDPPPDYDACLLIAGLRDAARAVAVTAPDPGDGRVRVLRWGEQLHIQVIRPASATANPTAIAAYVAKYATKAPELAGCGPTSGDLD